MIPIMNCRDPLCLKLYEVLKPKSAIGIFELEFPLKYSPDEQMEISIEYNYGSSFHMEILSVLFDLLHDMDFNY